MIELSLGTIMILIGITSMVVCNLVICILGFTGWKKGLKPEKLQKLYEDRKASKLFTPEEWEVAANYVTTKQGRISFIFGGLGLILVSSSALIWIFSANEAFMNIAIAGNLVMIIPMSILTAKISKKKYGISIFGLDGFTNAEGKAYAEHMANSRAENKP
jgi:hypothetical protein